MYIIKGSPGSNRITKNTIKVTKMSTTSANNSLRMIYVVTPFTSAKLTQNITWPAT